MFTVGDKIVYPMHGAGIIRDIEVKNILGKNQNYYILKLPGSDMNVMIPVENQEAVGIRAILSARKKCEKLSNFCMVKAAGWSRTGTEDTVKIWKN